MADVMGGKRDRAQLLLVGALALAVVFLSLSLLLNSVIYTENLATRQTHADAEKAETFRIAVVDGLGGAIDHANRLNTTSVADRRDAYRNATDSLIPILSNYSATDGLAADVDREDVQEGTRIVDDNASTGVVARNGSGTWTVATDSKVRAFRLNVTPSTVDQPSDTVITFDDGTAQEIHIEDDGGRQVDVVGVGTCELETGRIDIGAGTVDGDHCGPLADVRPTDNVNVTVENGDRIEATYSLIVDRDQAGFRTAVDAANYPGQCTPSAPSVYASTNTDDPYTSPAIYAATARISVATQDIDYGRTVRAAPDEAGAPPGEPTFASFDVTQSGNNFTVDWTTVDPDGDTRAVDIRVRYVTNGTLYAAPVGAAANGTRSFNDVPSGYEYYINGTVREVADATSNRRVSEIHGTGGAC